MVFRSEVGHCHGLSETLSGLEKRTTRACASLTHAGLSKILAAPGGAQARVSVRLWPLTATASIPHPTEGVFVVRHSNDRASPVVKQA